MSFILAPCRQAAANVPLCLVDLENTAHLTIELRIDLPQALGHVFMYGGLADVKFLCGRADGCLVFEDVLPQLYRSLFYGTLHAITPSFVFCTLYEEQQKNITLAISKLLNITMNYAYFLIEVYIYVNEHILKSPIDPTYVRIIKVLIHYCFLATPNPYHNAVNHHSLFGIFMQKVVDNMQVMVYTLVCQGAVPRTLHKKRGN